MNTSPTFGGISSNPAATQPMSSSSVTFGRTTHAFGGVQSSASAMFSGALTTTCTITSAMTSQPVFSVSPSPFSGSTQPVSPLFGGTTQATPSATSVLGGASQPTGHATSQLNVKPKRVDLSKQLHPPASTLIMQPSETSLQTTGKSLIIHMKM